MHVPRAPIEDVAVIHLPRSHKRGCDTAVLDVGVHLLRSVAIQIRLSQSGRSIDLSAVRHRGERLSRV